MAAFAGADTPRQRQDSMKDWNVIITIFQDGFRCAIRALHKLGPVERSPYHNVLLMAVEDPHRFARGHRAADRDRSRSL